MAGHSRWAQVKHKKAGADAKRGAVFSKLARLITVAAREAGPDPNTNSKLRNAIEQARSAGIPKENVERAISRAAGGDEAEKLREVEYEAYGPGGTAMLITGLTDNPNRTTNEVKRILAELGGRLAEAGRVAWLFERRIAADFETPAADAEREALELALIDAGAEDTLALEGRLRAIVPPNRTEAFRERIEASGRSPIGWSAVAFPKNPIKVLPGDRARIRSLVAALEDHPDIHEVWTNVADLATAP